MTALLLPHVTIIDGTGAVPQPGMDVLVSDGRIRAIKPTGTLTIDPQQTQVYPLAGMTLLPGLIDCHVHLFADGGPAGRIDRNELPGLALLRAALHACRTLEAGITTVRDVGGQAHMEFALR